MLPSSPPAPSTLMSTSADDLQLNFLVGSSIHNNVSRLASETLFYGFFIAMFTYSITLFLKRRSKWMAFIAICAFLLGTVHWSATLSFTLTQIGALLKSDLELDVASRIALLPPKVFPLDTMAQWTGMLTPILSDATVIWRCLNIFPETKRLLLLPLTTLFATLGLSLFFLISLSDLTTWTSWANGSPPLPTLSDVQLSIFILSFCTNFLTTMVMGYKLWIHRMFITQLIGKGELHKSAQHVVSILLETGLVYSAFQLGLVGLAAAPAAKTSVARTTAMIFLVVYCQLSAMYPIAVIIIVQLNVSLIADSASLATIKTNATVEFTSMSESGNASDLQAFRTKYQGTTVTRGTSSRNDSLEQFKAEVAV